MWLRSLEISGFGHFKDFRIDGFSDGLTVLYGPNEAGKSTLTRFVNYALWGLQRGDARRFKPLRGGDLGGVLEFETQVGQRLRVGRRERELRALLGSSRVESDEELERILGLDRGLFGAIFSFDLDDLASVRGLGTEEARERLFSGALLGAGISVAEAQKQLGAQREVLWRPRAACEIRILEDGISDLKQRLAEGRRSARGVRALHEALRELELGRERCERDAARLLAEASRWEALQAAYPVFVDLQLAKEALAELSESKLRVDLAAAKVLQERLQVLAQARAAERSRLETAEQRSAETRRFPEGEGPDVALLERSREIRDVARECRRLGREYVENLRGQREFAERRFRRRLLDVGVEEGEFPRWTAAEIDGLKRAAFQAVQAAAVRERVAAAERVVAGADERVAAAVASQDVFLASELAAKGAGRRMVGWAVVGSLWAVSAALLVLGGVLVFEAMFVVGGVLIGLAVVLGAVVFLGLRAGGAAESRESDLAREGVRVEVAMAQAARAEAGRVLGDLERAAAEVSDADWLRAQASWVILASVGADSLEALLGAWKLAREMEDELADCDAQLAAALEKTARLQIGWRGSSGESWRSFCERMEALDARVSVALQAVETRAEAERAAAAAREKLADVRAALGVVDAQLAELLADAGVGSVEEFWRALQVEESRAVYKAKLAEAERGLRTILGGFWDGETLGELAGADLVGWETRAVACRERAADLQAAGREFGERLGERAAELRALETSEGIAHLEFELAQYESRLDAARSAYAELLLAGYLLDGAMSTFREAHQPNVLRLASGWLSEATGGRYTGLRASEDGKDLEILGAGGQVLGEGALSRGTTELLYIVLRLALVRDYAQRGLRMPMIMDDILVNLDPERAAAVADLLMRVSGEQQIIMLTCRPEVCDLFSEAKVVELGRFGSFVGVEEV